MIANNYEIQENANTWTPVAARITALSNYEIHILILQTVHGVSGEFCQGSVICLPAAHVRPIAAHSSRVTKWVERLPSGAHTMALADELERLYLLAGEAADHHPGEVYRRTLTVLEVSTGADGEAYLLMREDEQTWTTSELKAAGWFREIGS